MLTLPWGGCLESMCQRRICYQSNMGREESSRTVSGSGNAYQAWIRSITKRSVSWPMVRGLIK